MRLPSLRQTHLDWSGANRVCDWESLLWDLAFKLSVMGDKGSPQDAISLHKPPIRRTLDCVAGRRRKGCFPTPGSRHDGLAIGSRGYRSLSEASNSMESFKSIRNMKEKLGLQLSLDKPPQGSRLSGSRTASSTSDGNHMPHRGISGWGLGGGGLATVRRSKWAPPAPAAGRDSPLTLQHVQDTSEATGGQRLRFSKSNELGGRAAVEHHP